MRVSSWLVFAALVAALPAWAAEVAVRADRAGEAVLVSAEVFVPDADPAVAWSVLTDYDRYSEFVPDLHASRVRSRDAHGLVVEQRGDVRFLFMRQRVEATLAVSEVPLRSVDSVAIAGSFREFSGRYEIAPSGRGTRFTYAGRIVPGEAAPLWLTAAAVRWNVERHLEAMAGEMSRRAAPHRLAQRPQGGAAN